MEMKGFKSTNFSMRKVFNFYLGNSENNTLLINIMGHPASDIMRRNQNTKHIRCQINFLSTLQEN